jgi:putative solute:sodium symporter small subunit
MIEVGLGVLLVAGAVAMLAGVGGLLPGASGVDLLPLLGYGGIAFLLAAGGLLIASGLARRAMRNDPARRHALRTARVTTAALLVTAGLAVCLPLAAGPANLVRLDGMPLGYYLAAQGALIGLVILAFVWAARQGRIDAGESGDE